MSECKECVPGKIPNSDQSDCGKYNVEGLSI